jgi:threonine aldolase
MLNIKPDTTPDLVCDLRSDTVTRPTPAMRRAMAEAAVGDDVFGDDPTVNRLQAQLAERLGFEAGLLLPSGTMSNLCALMSHCQRGDEVILAQDGHSYRYEAGGAAVLGSIQPQPLDHDARGRMPLQAIEAAIKPDNEHFTRTRLVVLENTFCGRVQPLDYQREVAALARSRGLALHLDGARLFNAVVAGRADGIGERDWVAPFDSVSICLSKGLGAPVGSVLLGARAFIGRARRLRKMLGGGMRQAGVVAAAGLYALEHHVERLADDHARARQLAAALARVDGLQVEPPETNMVWVQGDAGLLDALLRHLAAHGVLALPGRPLRLVLHLDVDDAALARLLAIVARFEPPKAVARSSAPGAVAAAGCAVQARS